MTATATSRIGAYYVAHASFAETQASNMGHDRASHCGGDMVFFTRICRHCVWARLRSGRKAHCERHVHCAKFQRRIHPVQDGQIGQLQCVPRSGKVHRQSQHRASMFNSLISPIAGPQGGEKPMSADREMILTELLALNFNENFEMKPLMEDALRRLITEKPVKSKNGEDPREPLWSIARRIAERQKASIAREWSASEAAKSSGIFSFGSFLLPWKSAADSSHGCPGY